MRFSVWEGLEKLRRDSKRPQLSLPKRYESFRDGHYAGSWFFLLYTSVVIVLTFMWSKTIQLLKNAFRFIVDGVLFFVPLRRWFASFWVIFWGPWHLLFVFFGPFVLLFFNYLIYKVWAYLFFGPIVVTSSCFGFIVQECTTYVDFWYTIERLSVSRNWFGLSWMTKYYEYFWYLVKLYNNAYWWRPTISYQVFADELMRIGVHVLRVKLPAFPPKNFPIIHQFLEDNSLFDVSLRRAYSHHWRCIVAVYKDVLDQTFDAIIWVWWYAILNFDEWPLRTDEFLGLYKGVTDLKDRYYDLYYFDPVKRYLKKWLSFYPGLPNWGPSIRLYIEGFTNFVLIGFTQFFSIKPYIIFLCRLSDPVFIVEFLGSKVVFIIICIYGLPFLVVSYIAIYMSAALASVELLLWSFFCMFVDCYLGSFGSMLDFIKRALSSNPKINFRPRELIILYLADLWMVFYILPILAILLVIPVGCIFLSWYVFCVPMIWVYFIVYTPSGSYRGFSDIFRLFAEQIFLIFYIFKIKIAYFKYYVGISYTIVKGCLVFDRYGSLRDEFQSYADNKDFDCSLDKGEFFKNEDYYSLRLVFVRLAKSKPIEEKVWYGCEHLVSAWGSESCWYSDVQAPEPKLTHSFLQIFFRTVILISTLFFVHVLLNFGVLTQILSDAAAPTKLTGYMLDRVVHKDIGRFPDDFGMHWVRDDAPIGPDGWPEPPQNPDGGWEFVYYAWDNPAMVFWYAELVYIIASWYSIYALLFFILVFCFAVVSRTFKEILLGSSYFFFCSLYSAFWFVFANGFGEDFLTSLHPATWHLDWMREIDFTSLDEDLNFVIRGFSESHNVIEDTLISRRSERKYQETYWRWWSTRRVNLYVPIYNLMLESVTVKDAQDAQLVASRFIKDVFTALHTEEWWSGKKSN